MWKRPSEFKTIRACLAWSGAGTEAFSLPLFIKLLKTYCDAGGSIEKGHADAVLSAVFGSTINWLLYNTAIIGGNNPANSKTAMVEIRGCLTRLSKFMELYPVLLDAIIRDI